MTTPRTMPVRFLRAAASTAQLRGIDLDPWMDRLGIDPALLFDDRSRITLEQATRIVQELWRRTDDELFGLSVERVPRGTFRLLCLAVLSAPDLGTVLNRWSDFSRVLPGLPPFEVHVTPTTTRVEITVDPERDPACFVTDIALVVNLRFLSWLVGRRLPLEVVMLPYPIPDEPADYEVVFGQRVTYDQPVAGFVLDSAAMTLPVVRDERATEKWLRDSPLDLLRSRDHSTTVADQVRHIFERGLRGDWATSDEVAAKLAISTQHLRRALREEDTSMSRIKEELLRDAAVTSLVRGEESVSDLSARLGFSEPSAFYRAFRRWTGSAPGSYRSADRPAVDAPR
ncbi:AraC family transcriptional regulator [Leekyejoonella antrihumi]|uniref:AraC family transcriptional regulator n=1 Tax=Leekyejoonella antrihumi TaxID=1660198 RepID=A0A563DWN8_9MICO|nr:AraC family transcriptional regulator [Leekyejoonella antrihumi]TWP34114.1 AraC family transcriptional regulator [Leekyejoonella antrihumi]